MGRRRRAWESRSQEKVRDRATQSLGARLIDAAVRFVRICAAGRHAVSSRRHWRAEQPRATQKLTRGASVIAVHPWRHLDELPDSFRIFDFRGKLIVLLNIFMDSIFNRKSKLFPWIFHERSIKVMNQGKFRKRALRFMERCCHVRH